MTGSLRNQWEFTPDEIWERLSTHDQAPKMSNYAEGLVSATHGAPGTLGALCDRLTDWPHDKVKESLKNLYKFCSDYPGIRHAGNPASQLRVLGGKDSVMISVLLIAFSGYLSPQIDAQVVLGS